jgi:hypothetical protein
MRIAIMRHWPIALFAMCLLAAAPKPEKQQGVAVHVIPTWGQATENGVTFSIVSNVERIAIEIIVPTTPAKINGSTPETPTSPVFQLTATSLADQKVVNVRQTVTGVHATPNNITVTLLVDLPINDDEQRSMLNRYIDELLQEATTDERAALVAQRPNIIESLRRVFIQNRLGDFVLRVELRDPRLASGDAEAVVRVIDKGTFVTKLRRVPPTARNER